MRTSRAVSVMSSAGAGAGALARLAWFLVLLAGLAGCGDDGPPGGMPDSGVPDGGVPDARVDAPPDSGVDGGIDGPIDGGSPDGPMPGAPRLLSVVTPYDGSDELRQASFTLIVLSGENLHGATSVTIGGRPVTITGVTPPGTVPSRISGNYDTGHGHPIGPMAVTVTTPRGATTLEGGVEVTPFVVAPAAFGGRGTYDSPMGLCDWRIQQESGSGDTISLLGGIHECDGALVLSGGQTVTGAPMGTTFITGDFAGFHIGSDGETTRLRLLTLYLAGVDRGITFDDPSGRLELELVVITSGIAVTRSASVLFSGVRSKVDRTEYGGPGVLLTSEEALLQGSEIWCSGSLDEGILLRATEAGRGRYTFTQTIVQQCDRGIRLGEPPPPDGPDPSLYPQLTITDSELFDNRTALEVYRGHAELREVKIHADFATDLPSDCGILVRNGRAEMFGGAVREHNVGAMVDPLPASGTHQPSAQLSLDGVELDRGSVGVLVPPGRADAPTSSIKLRRTTSYDQVTASVQVGSNLGVIDLGTAADPGGNMLSVRSGHALDDLRLAPGTPGTPGRVIQAVGSTLNGRSYAGQLIEGPATLMPDYRIWSTGAIQF